MAQAAPTLDSVRHDFVDAGGLRMHVVEAGPPDGEPVLSSMAGRSTGTSGGTRSPRWPAPATG